MIFTHLALFSFFKGAGGSQPNVSVPATTGGAADRKRPVRWGHVGGRYVAVESDTELERLRNRLARRQHTKEVVPHSGHKPEVHNARLHVTSKAPGAAAPHIGLPPIPIWNTRPADDQSGSIKILAELERSLHQRRMRRRQQEEEALLLLLDD